MTALVFCSHLWSVKKKVWTSRLLQCLRRERDVCNCPALRRMMVTAAKPGIYLGASWLLNTRLPAIPPIPPNPVSVALQKALFHCPRILFAWYAIQAGMLALTPATAMKTPKYLTPLLEAKAMMGRPMIEMAELPTRMMARTR